MIRNFSTKIESLSQFCCSVSYDPCFPEKPERKDQQQQGPLRSRVPRKGARHQALRFFCDSHEGWFCVSLWGSACHRKRNTIRTISTHAFFSVPGTRCTYSSKPTAANSIHHAIIYLVLYLVQQAVHGN